MFVGGFDGRELTLRLLVLYVVHLFVSFDLAFFKDQVQMEGNSTIACLGGRTGM